MTKILVIQTAFIGDVILSTALLEKLHKYLPDSQIDFLVRSGNEILFKEHPFIGKIWVWKKKKPFKTMHLISLCWKVRRCRYDIVIDVQRFAATGLLTVFSGAKKTIGFNKNPLSRFFSDRIEHLLGTKDCPIHEVERNQKLIEHFTDPIAAAPRLYPSVSDEQKTVLYKKEPYICIAPSSVWFTKKYPISRWIELIHAFEDHYMVYLLGGKSDYELCEAVSSECSHLRISNLAGQLNLLQSASLMRDAVMNYVNDSAPMHLCSSVNAPVCAVYCSTVPYFGFGPLSTKSFIVEVKEALSCRPCSLHGRKVCPLGHFDCAMKIEKQQLLKTLPN